MKTTVLRINVELRDALKEVAKDEGRTMVGLIKIMLKEHKEQANG